MGFTVFLITVIVSCLFVGVFADSKSQHEELHYMYKIFSARYCNMQNEIKKLQKEIKEIRGEEE